MSDGNTSNFGKMWTIEKRFSTFEDADSHRNDLKTLKNVEVKIHKHATVFVVKTRLLEGKVADVPTVVADEPQVEIVKVRAPKQKRGEKSK